MSRQPLLLREVQVLDAQKGLSKPVDVRVVNGKIDAIGQDLTSQSGEVIHGRGLILTAGFVDLRACAREPGDEHEEDLVSLSDAANAGGFTAVVVSPDTTPGNDDHAVTELILRRAREYGRCDVLPQGALSHRLKGETLAPMGEMSEAGAVCFGDGDRPMKSARLQRRALEYARGFDRPIFTHAIDTDLAGTGTIHEGPWSTRLGMRAIPSAAESIIVARDIAVTQLANSRLHFARITTAKSVDLIRAAKAEGIRVTASVTPWHLTLTDAAMRDYDVNLKLVAPLRSEADRQALLAGLADGTIDAICSDHTPVNIAGKALEFDYAAPGAIAIQTALAQVLTCVRAGELKLEVALNALTAGPRKVLQMNGGQLVEGAVADLTLIDPKAIWTLDASTNKSKSRNTILWGQELMGRAVLTVFRGKVVHRA
jgi:dihydroorotase